MTIEKTNSDRIIINIDGEKGNAFFLMGQAKAFAKDLSLDSSKIIDEMQSGNYINLLKVFDSYFGDYVTLQTSNAEYLDAFESMWTVK